MKQVLSMIMLALFVSICNSQNSFYIGYENGGKWDNFSYINSKGYQLTQLQLDGVLSLNVGYRFEKYTIESGMQGFYLSFPIIKYDYTTCKPGKSLASGGGSAMNSWVIPLRFGKEFLMCKNRLILKPEMSFTTIIARDYSENQPMSEWGENVSFPGDTSFVPTSPDSTRGHGHRTSKVNFGVESGLSLGYRFKNIAEIYCKGSIHYCLNPLYYDVITHYSSTGEVHATNTMTGVSYLFQIGLRYYFSSI